MVRFLVLAGLVLALTTPTIQAQSKTIKGELKEGQTENIEEMKLKKGETLLLDMNSPDFDTYIRVRDSQGNQVAFDDDGGEKLNSRLLFKVPKNDTYQIVATSFRNSGIGKYTLKIAKGKIKLLLNEKGKITDKSKRLKIFPMNPRL